MAAKRLYMAMVVMQMTIAGMAMTSKVAFNIGMNTFVFLFYRQALATLLWLPLSLIFVRRNATPLHFKRLLKIFFMSMIGLTINLDVYNMTIKFNSTIVATVATNALPILTFIIVVETLNTRRIPGMLKLFGVLLCLAGVLVIAFYKGPILISLNSNHPIMYGSAGNHHVIPNSKRTWIKGTFLMVMATVAWSSWILSQVGNSWEYIKEYRHVLIFQTLGTSFSTFQSFLITITFERCLATGWPTPNRHGHCCGPAGPG
ncbi:WAT1-related protein [Dioscorea alata]|uniref:WAT1-related protein n=1 Tax=Dioscorea alata TaxID=55571 RepID=A0ACB7US58_DIOAL|nr:WAT1-related protein [Dioscorea alata]